MRDKILHFTETQNLKVNIIKENISFWMETKLPFSNDYGTEIFLKVGSICRITVKETIEQVENIYNGNQTTKN